MKAPSRNPIFHKDFRLKVNGIPTPIANLLNPLPSENPQDFCERSFFLSSLICDMILAGQEEGTRTIGHERFLVQWRPRQKPQPLLGWLWISDGHSWHHIEQLADLDCYLQNAINIYPGLLAFAAQTTERALIAWQAPDAEAGQRAYGFLYSAQKANKPMKTHVAQNYLWAHQIEALQPPELPPCGLQTSTPLGKTVLRQAELELSLESSVKPLALQNPKRLFPPFADASEASYWRNKAYRIALSQMLYYGFDRNSVPVEQNFGYEQLHLRWNPPIPPRALQGHLWVWEESRWVKFKNKLSSYRLYLCNGLDQALILYAMQEESEIIVRLLGRDRLTNAPAAIEYHFCQNPPHRDLEYPDPATKAQVRLVNMEIL